MSFFVCINNVTVYKRSFNAFSFKAEWHNFAVTGLFFQLRKVYRFTQNAGRSSCLKTSCCKTKTMKTFCKSISGRLANTAARCIIFTNKNTTAKKGSGCQNNRAHRNNSPALCNHAGYLLTHSTFCCLCAAITTEFAGNSSFFCSRVAVWRKRS